ncbi:MAG: ChaN family lipoprotein [bacterium]
MGRARVVLLGEKHDNPVHHRLQARLLRALLRLGRRPALAFEMFPRTATPALKAHLSQPGADLARVPAIVGWRTQGWPDWKMYAPLVEIAAGAGLPVIGTDLSRAVTRRVARGGLAALPPGLARELALGPPGARHRARVLDALHLSHCRVVPRASLGGLYDAWRARNRAMALSLRAALANGSEGAVLITGSGHADRATGVPPEMADLSPGISQFSLAFTEVREDMRRAADYGGEGAFDALWFTRRREREDPCRKHRRQLERLRDRR